LALLGPAGNSSFNECGIAESCCKWLVTLGGKIGGLHSLRLAPKKELRCQLSDPDTAIINRKLASAAIVAVNWLPRPSRFAFFLTNNISGEGLFLLYIYEYS
jgi:hypothetical protein